MAIGRAERRAERTDRVRVLFGERDAGAALDLLDLFELAWHDCYGEVTPPVGVMEDVLLLSNGSIAGLIRECRQAVIDWRDTRVAADRMRRRDLSD